MVACADAPVENRRTADCGTAHSLGYSPVGRQAGTSSESFQPRRLAPPCGSGENETPSASAGRQRASRPSARPHTPIIRTHCPTSRSNRRRSWRRKVPGGTAGLQNQVGHLKMPGGFDSLPSPPDNTALCSCDARSDGWTRATGQPASCASLFVAVLPGDGCGRRSPHAAEISPREAPCVGPHWLFAEQPTRERLQDHGRIAPSRES